VNKVFIYTIFFLLSISLVMAPGPQDTTTGGTDKELKSGSDEMVGGILQQEKTELQNQGEETQNQVATQAKTMAKSGEYTTEAGQKIQLMAKENNQMEIKSGNVIAKTEMKMTQEGEMTELKVQLSNGRNAEIKVMPDTASETALTRIGLKVCLAEEGCTIELKEVGKGETVEPAYEVEAETEGRFLGLFKTKAKVKTQISAETGEILRVKKPFLTTVKTVEATE
jgi:hypothetical protein